EAERKVALRDGCANDERWHQRKDGSQFFASGVLTPIRDEGGEVIAFTKVCRDITERKRSMEQAATILESITDAFFAVNRAWQFTYVNAEAERVLRQKRQTLLGANLWELFPAARGTQFERRYHEAMNEGKT